MAEVEKENAAVAAEEEETLKALTITKVENSAEEEDLKKEMIKDQEKEAEIRISRIQ